MANSRFPLIVNSSAGQIQELNSSDALVVNSGAGLGISFTPNPGGGTGDFATITYEVVTGEQTNFKIAVQNDGSSSNKDNIELSTPNGASINVTADTASTNKTTGALIVTGGVGISGALNVGGDITAFATSDEKLKENLVPIPNAVDKVGIITGYTYKWKTEGTDYASVHGTEDTGVIAQQIEALGLPGITTTRENGTKAISYKRLIPILIEAIKELDTRLKTLEG